MVQAALHLFLEGRVSREHLFDFGRRGGVRSVLAWVSGLRSVERVARVGEIGGLFGASRDTAVLARAVRLRDPLILRVIALPRSQHASCRLMHHWVV